MNNENTTVETVDMDLNDILNIGSSVMLPASDKNAEAKPNMFSRKSVDLSFLDKPLEEDEEEKDHNPAQTAFKAEAAAAASDTAKANAAGTVKEAFDDETINNLITAGDEDATKGGSRSKTDKDGLIELTKKLIEKKLLVAFDDDKPIDKYSIQDFEELFEANDQEKSRKTSSQLAEQFFESLPPEFQYAHQYVQNGGRDIKGLFKTLAHVEEVRQMDPTKDGDAKHIARSYLQATHQDWTSEEIEEEIVGYEDRNELEAKALKFQPKLAALTEQQVAYKLQQQEALRAQQVQQSHMYMDNIYKTLEPGELNGLKLDKKTQNLLFAGLVQPNYPSSSGNPTNLLGHLLEKYQYAEPNHGLLAEALWLLADPDGYRNKVREGEKKIVTAETVRKLKSEEGRKLASHVPDDEGTDSREKQYKIPRPSGQNFFKRENK
jgi:hypothetical protein